MLAFSRKAAKPQRKISRRFKMSHHAISAAQLEMKREKPRSLPVSLSYRAASLGRRVLGRERMLRFFLNGSRLLWLFGFELSGAIYDKAFHNQTKALSEDFLRRSIPQNGSVIDIGCGPGRWCEVASKYAASVVGIDNDESLIRWARQESSAENIEYVVGDITRDLGNRSFDLALLTHVIEHFDDAGGLLRDIRRIAEKLIVEVPDFENDPLNWVRLRQGCQFYTDADHVREYTLDTLTVQVENNGWRVVESRKSGGSVLVLAERASD